MNCMKIKKLNLEYQKNLFTTKYSCCNKDTHISYENLKIICESCKAEKCAFQHAQDALSNVTPLVNSAFNLLSLLNIAKIYNALAIEEYQPLNEYYFDLNIGNNSRVLYLNITAQGSSVNKNEYTLWPVSYLKNETKIWGEIDHRLHLIGLPIKDRDLESIPKLQANHIDHLLNEKIAIYIIWYAGGSVIEDHMVQAAEALYKKNSAKMIYNVFSAIELRLRKVVANWLNKKKLPNSVYKKFFLKSNIENLISLLKEISQEINISYDSEKEQLLKKLREKRNVVVHDRLNNDYNKEYDNFFAVACWYLSYFNIIEKEMENT